MKTQGEAYKEYQEKIDKLNLAREEAMITLHEHLQALKALSRAEGK